MHPYIYASMHWCIRASMHPCIGSNSIHSNIEEQNDPPGRVVALGPKLGHHVALCGHKNVFQWPGGWIHGRIYPKLTRRPTDPTELSIKSGNRRTPPAELSPGGQKQVVLLHCLANRTFSSGQGDGSVSGSIRKWPPSPKVEYESGHFWREFTLPA